MECVTHTLYLLLEAKKRVVCYLLHDKSNVVFEVYFLFICIQIYFREKSRVRLIFKKKMQIIIKEKENVTNSFRGIYMCFCCVQG